MSEQPTPEPRGVDEDQPVDPAAATDDDDLTPKRAGLEVTTSTFGTVTITVGEPVDLTVEADEPSSFLEQAVAVQADVDAVPADATKKVRRLTPSYLYRGRVVRWVDGDTLDVEVDLGFHMTANLRVRVNNLDTPERGHPLWKAAGNRARELAPAPSEVLLRTYKDADKYGRWLADVQSELCDDVATVLVAEGLAVRYDGGTKSAW